MIERQPLAFMSYSHIDDDHDSGYLTKFRTRLSGEVRVLTAKDFPIFQDREDISWGQNWKKRIVESLQAVTFLIPIITPNYFASQACREELKQFIEYETKLGRSDLILPIYYVTSSLIDKKEKGSDDELVKAIKDHQYRDWRELRGKNQKSAKFSKNLTKLAAEISKAIDRIDESQETTFYEEPSLENERSRKTSSDRKDLNAALYRTKNTSDEIKIKTIIVDQDQKGDYDNINEAIRAANPGDKILIHQGIYQEELIIDKPLEIIGEGNRGTIIIQSSTKSVLVSITPTGHVTNISLKQTGGNWFCVDLAYGNLMLADCDISSQGSSCIGIHHGANPILRNNSIHESKQSGIFIFDNGRGLLENNDIYGNTFSGVEIKNFANPVLRHNNIHDGKQGGILVHDNGMGLIEHNEIFNNIIGAEIRHNGNPTLLHNTIRNNKQQGIIIHDKGIGTFEDNDIFGNGYDGVGIRFDSNPILRRNKIHDGMQGGIFVLDGGLGVLEYNEIFGNESDGVAIRSKGNPKLRHNRIFNGKSDGVYIWEKGLGIIEDNDIFGNFYGIEIETESNPVLQRNSIHDNRQSGIRIQTRGHGIVEMNDIFGNSVAGIEISSLANPVVRYNKIHDSRQSGLFIHHEGKGTIENNDIFGNTYSGVEISAMGNPTMKYNNIHNGFQNGVLVLDSGRGILSNNNILWNKFSGVLIEKAGNVTLKNNYINLNELEAIRVRNGGGGIVEENDLRGNGRGPWAIENTAADLRKERNLE